MPLVCCCAKPDCMVNGCQQARQYGQEEEKG